MSPEDHTAFGNFSCQCLAFKLTKRLRPSPRRPSTMDTTSVADNNASSTQSTPWPCFDIQHLQLLSIMDELYYQMSSLFTKNKWHSKTCNLSLPIFWYPLNAQYNSTLIQLPVAPTTAISTCGSASVYDKFDVKYQTSVCCREKKILHRLWLINKYTSLSASYVVALVILALSKAKGQAFSWLLWWGNIYI